MSVFERPSRLQLLFLAGALLVGALTRIDAAGRIYPPDRDQRTDVRRYYASMAQSALEGKGWLPSYPTNFIPPPGQAFFIYGLKRVWPSADYQHMRSVQALVSLATILLGYLLATLLHNAWSGVLCAWMIALSYRLSYLVGMLLAETNHIFFLFAFALCLVWALRTRRFGGLAAVGFLLGIACLFRPLPTLLAPTIALQLGLMAPRADGWRRGLLLLAGFVLAIAPWTIRNFLHYGHLYPISTNGGTLLALSNSPGLDSSRPEMRYWDDLYSLPYYKDAAIEAAFEGHVDVDGKPEENLKDRAYLRKTISYIAASPAHFARNYAYKAWSFLSYPRQWTPPLGTPGPLPFREVPFLTGTIVILGLLGTALFMRWDALDPARFSVAVIVLYQLAIGTLFHLTSDGRMNLPFQAFLAVPGAVLMVSVTTALRRRIRR